MSHRPRSSAPTSLAPPTSLPPHAHGRAHTMNTAAGRNHLHATAKPPLSHQHSASAAAVPPATTTSTTSRDTPTVLEAPDEDFFYSSADTGGPPMLPPRTTVRNLIDFDELQRAQLDDSPDRYHQTSEDLQDASGGRGLAGVGERVRELEGELSAKEEELNFLRFELEMKENEKKIQMELLRSDHEAELGALKQRLAVLPPTVAPQTPEGEQQSTAPTNRGHLLSNACDRSRDHDERLLFVDIAPDAPEEVREELELLHELLARKATRWEACAASASTNESNHQAEMRHEAAELESFTDKLQTTCHNLTLRLDSAEAQLMVSRKEHAQTVNALQRRIQQLSSENENLLNLFHSTAPGLLMANTKSPSSSRSDQYQPGHQTGYKNSRASAPSTAPAIRLPRTPDERYFAAGGAVSSTSASTLENYAARTVVGDGSDGSRNLKLNEQRQTRQSAPPTAGGGGVLVAGGSSSSSFRPDPRMSSTQPQLLRPQSGAPSDYTPPTMATTPTASAESRQAFQHYNISSPLGANGTTASSVNTLIANGPNSRTSSANTPTSSTTVSQLGRYSRTAGGAPAPSGSTEYGRRTRAVGGGGGVGDPSGAGTGASSISNMFSGISKLFGGSSTAAAGGGR